MLGWLLTASVTYRLRERPARRPATLCGAAVVALAGPPLACYANFALMVRTAGDGSPPATVHSALSARLFDTYGGRWLMLELAVTGLVLGVAALALAARGRGEQPGPAVSGTA
jgi:hypothetical protein